MRLSGTPGYNLLHVIAWWITMARLVVYNHTILRIPGTDHF